MRQQIQLWQHSKIFASTIMFVVRLHLRLLKLLSFNLILKAQFSISKKGHVGDVNKDRRTVENTETDRLSVIEGPKKSYRKRAQALNMKPTSLLTIVRKDIKLILPINATLFSSSIIPIKQQN